MRIALVEPSQARLTALADRLSAQRLTYPEVGASRDPDALPAGYSHDRRCVRIGDGREAFDLGKEALVSWQAHRALGATLTPEVPPLRPGQVVVATIPLGPPTAIVPCRIVYVTDDVRRFGFAYGTLPGHPERGEESFHVVEAASGEVTFEIVAFSRPADLLVRLGGRVARRVQVRSTDAYLEGVRRFVENRRQRRG